MGQESENTSSHWQPPFHQGQVFISDIAFDTQSIRDFATMIRDSNMLHHDEDFARQTRFGGLIASGGHTISMLLGTLAEHIAEHSHSLGLECNFTLRQAVKAGAMMTAKWSVISIEPRPSMRGHVMKLEGSLRDQDGVCALAATLDVLVMPKEALFAALPVPGKREIQ